jgi:hypothetical protein
MSEKTLSNARELGEDEFLQLLEERVVTSLNMSLTDFITALDAGKLDPESPRVADLAILVGAPAR